MNWKIVIDRPNKKVSVVNTRTNKIALTLFVCSSRNIDTAIQFCKTFEERGLK